MHQKYLLRSYKHDFVSSFIWQESTDGRDFMDTLCTFLTKKPPISDAKLAALYNKGAFEPFYQTRLSRLDGPRDSDKTKSPAVSTDRRRWGQWGGAETVWREHQNYDPVGFSRPLEADAPHISWRRISNSASRSLPSLLSLAGNCTKSRPSHELLRERL